MKKTKQIDTYYCDYCGKECDHTEFVMPYGEEKVEYAKDGYGNKIMPCHYTEPIAKIETFVLIARSELLI